MRFPVVFMLFFSITSVAMSSPANIFTTTADIGNPAIKGATIFNKADEFYQLKGGGYNIWFNRDEFQYAWRRISGNFILTANFKLMGKGSDPHRKMGWMIRNGASEDASHISAVIHADGLTVMQWRKLPGAQMRSPEDQILTSRKKIEIIQLERWEKSYIMRVANPGEPLQEIARLEMSDMPDSVLAGLFICSHNKDEMEEGIAWNVRIEKTVREDHNGYTDGALASRLELMNVFDGKRKIIHEDAGRFEAPNWMPDGNRLLFNQGGFIYTIPVAGGTPQKLNTGTATRNNNDHVISFDGKMLGISSHRNGMTGGGSTIYVLSLAGGEPVLITDSTPSYLHSWHPNGKEVLYTAQRISKNRAYNLYKKPVNGGPEVQLTFNETGVVDGPEFSPDGKYIYCNSDETGMMQLWRMKTDGSDKEQLTFDNYNNWFPHISPDGKWMVYLSFPPTINASDHPFYKRVMLRMMPVSGGAPRVIAYLYGGQGTINTPSWSPDSKSIAFVSNSKALE